jgi:hypothetical protein
MRASMGDEGLERIEFSPGNLGSPSRSGAQSGALPAELARVVDRWPILTKTARHAILRLVDKAKRPAGVGAR